MFGQDDLHLWAIIGNSQRVQLDDDQVSFAPPEYVIVRKLEFFREGGSEKHLRDIGRMAASSRERRLILRSCCPG